MATVTIEYYGFSGSGKNVTEAKRDAGRQIEALQRGYWWPQVFSLGGNSHLVYRDLYGWQHASIRDNGEMREGTIHGGSAYSRDDAVATAIYCLACDYPDMTAEHDLWQEIRDAAERKRRISDWKYHVAFQRAYKAAPEDCEDKHRWACDHSRQFAI